MDVPLGCAQFSDAACQIGGGEAGILTAVSANALRLCSSPVPIAMLITDRR